MYLIWIGWLYFVVMFSVAQGSVARGVLMLVLLGVLPTLFMGWVLRQRRRNRQARALEEQDMRGKT
jgi:sulfite exporter TauE/SafE